MEKRMKQNRAEEALTPSLPCSWDNSATDASCFSKHDAGTNYPPSSRDRISRKHGEEMEWANPHAFPKIQHVFLHGRNWIRKHLEKVKSFFCPRYPFMYKMLPSSSNY